MRPSITNPLAGRARLLPIPKAAAQAAALAVAMTSMATVQAQQAEPKKDTGQMETVVITGTKRAQPLQQTPIAVSVIGGAGLEEANLNNLGSIQAQIPAVTFRSNASSKDTSLFIRGVGTISTSPGVEPTVATVIDGVVTGRPGQAMLDLVDVDRIEVLRGPQGTLFGRNASAGVINIVTKEATKGLGGYVDLSAFSGNELRGRASISGGTDTAKASLALMKAKWDGLLTNVFDGSTTGGYDREGARLRLDLAPVKDLKVTLIGDYSNGTDRSPAGVPVGTDVRAYPSLAVTANPLFGAALGAVVPSASNRQINNNLETTVTDKNQGLSAQVDYSLGGLQFTSITAHRTWKNVAAPDGDRLSTIYRQFAQSHDLGILDFKQFTQEFRVASTEKQFVDYVAGLFYYDGKTDEVYRRDVVRCPSTTAAALASGLVPCSAGSEVADNGVATYGVRSKSIAAFGEGTFNISSSLRAIAGLRYTVDDLSYYHGRVATNTGVPGVQPTRATVTGSTTEKAVSGRFGPQFDLSKDMMVYATYSRGYKGPAYNVFFNMTATQDNVLAPEKSNSYEVGLKSELMDRRVRLNIAAFSTEYSGYQANVPDLVNGVIVTRLINAGEVSTKGLEMDLTARVTTDFTVSAALANTIARVKNFNCPPGAAASCDINGKSLPYAPEWKAALRLKYNQSLSDKLSMEYGADMTWQSKTNFDLQQQPDSVQDSFGIINARIALQSSDGWTVAVVGRNLTDQSYSTLTFNAGNHISRYVPRDDKRYFGVNVRYEF
jgi:iron complex outermembrane recepter protein